MRRRSGLPAKITPNMSKTSRSSQPATGHSVVTVGTGRVLGGVDLDHDAVVFGQAEQAIIALEAFGALGVVDPGDFHQLLVFVFVAQQAQGILDSVPLRR